MCSPHRKPGKAKKGKPGKQARPGQTRPGRPHGPGRPGRPDRPGQIGCPSACKDHYSQALCITVQHCPALSITGDHCFFLMFHDSLRSVSGSTLWHDVISNAQSSLAVCFVHAIEIFLLVGLTFSHTCPSHAHYNAQYVQMCDSSSASTLCLHSLATLLLDLCLLDQTHLTHSVLLCMPCLSCLPCLVTYASVIQRTNLMVCFLSIDA